MLAVSSCGGNSGSGGGGNVGSGDDRLACWL